jgi:hypothetical protein
MAYMRDQLADKTLDLCFGMGQTQRYPKLKKWIQTHSNIIILDQARDTIKILSQRRDM